MDDEYSHLVPWYKTMVVFRWGVNFTDSNKTIEVFNHKNFAELTTRIEDYIGRFNYKIRYQYVIAQGSFGSSSWDLDETSFDRIKMTEGQYDSRHRNAENSNRVEITLAPNSDMDCSENPFVPSVACYDEYDQWGKENPGGADVDSVNPHLSAMISIHNRLKRLESKLGCNNEYVFTQLLNARTAFESGNLKSAAQVVQGLGLSKDYVEFKRFDGKFGEFLRASAI